MLLLQHPKKQNPSFIGTRRRRRRPRKNRPSAPPFLSAALRSAHPQTAWILVITCRTSLPCSPVTYPHLYHHPALHAALTLIRTPSLIPHCSEGAARFKARLWPIPWMPISLVFSSFFLSCYVVYSSSLVVALGQTDYSLSLSSFLSRFLFYLGRIRRRRFRSPETISFFSGLCPCLIYYISYAFLLIGFSFLLSCLLLSRFACFVYSISASRGRGLFSYRPHGLR